MGHSQRNATRGVGLLEDVLARQRSRLANRLIPDGYRKGRILDIGCGRYPFFLINTRFTEKCGMDKLVREGYDKHFADSGITFVRYNIGNEKKLPFGSSHFDVVTMLAVIEHLHPLNLAEGFSEIYRVLKPSGAFIITTPNPIAAPLLRVMARLRLISRVEIREHKFLYSHSLIKAVLTKAGFATEDLRAGHYFLNTWTKVLK